MSGEVGATSEETYHQVLVHVSRSLASSDLYSQEEEAFGRGRLLQLSQHKWSNQNPPQVRDALQYQIVCFFLTLTPPPPSFLNIYVADYIADYSAK